MNEDVRRQMRKVCDRLLDGENILDICERRDPSFSQLMHWVKTDDEAALMLDETREMVRSRWVATLESIGTREYKTNVQASAAKLHSDNLRWLLEKEWSDKYGSRIGIDVNVDVNLRVALDKSLSRLGTLVQTPLLDAAAVVGSSAVIDVLPETVEALPSPEADVDPMS